MIVISELTHAHILNGSTASKAEMEKRPDIVHDTAVSLSIKPGANFIVGTDLVKFNAVKVHPDFLRMVDEGQMRVIDDSKTKGKKGGDGVPETLEGIEGPMAVSLVKSTMDAEILGAWQDEEERESVKKAIREQIKMVKEIDAQRKEAQDLARV